VDANRPLTMLPLTVPPSCEVCGAMFRARWRVPLGSLRRHVTRCRQTPELRGEASLAVHRPSVCSGVKALRNTSDAKAASRQAALAFRSPLTPSARSGNLIAGDGTKNGISRSEQRTVSKPKRTISGSTAQPRGKSPLTGKAPYKSGANLAFGGRSQNCLPAA
jgi:hypothetical protein